MFLLILNIVFVQIYCTTSAPTPKPPRTNRGFPCENKKSINTKFVVGVGRFPCTFHCSGSLLNEFWVLTAGHCIKDIDEAYVIPGHKRGDYCNTKFNPECVCKECHCHIFRSSGLFVHPKFDWTSLRHDIGLILLTNKINLNKHVKLVRIPKRPTSNMSTGCYVMGWGATIQRRSVRASLCLSAKIMDVRQCGRYFGRGEIIKGNLCTEKTEEAYPCQGDSGGPLVCGNVQYGIVSEEISCDLDVPGVYTRVDQYLDFIKFTLRHQNATNLKGNANILFRINLWFVILLFVAKILV